MDKNSNIFRSSSSVAQFNRNSDADYCNGIPMTGSTLFNFRYNLQQMGYDKGTRIRIGYKNHGFENIRLYINNQNNNNPKYLLSVNRPGQQGYFYSLGISCSSPFGDYAFQARDGIINSISNINLLTCGTSGDAILVSGAPVQSQTVKEFLNQRITKDKKGRLW